MGYDYSLPLLPADMATARFYLKLLLKASRRRVIGGHAAAGGDLIWLAFRRSRARFGPHWTRSKRHDRESALMIRESQANGAGQRLCMAIAIWSAEPYLRY
jgi:hypothetical protein